MYSYGQGMFIHWFSAVDHELYNSPDMIMCACTWSHAYFVFPVQKCLYIFDLTRIISLTAYMDFASCQPLSAQLVLLALAFKWTTCMVTSVLSHTVSWIHLSTGPLKIDLCTHSVGHAFITTCSTPCAYLLYTAQTLLESVQICLSCGGTQTGPSSQLFNKHPFM